MLGFVEHFRFHEGLREPVSLTQEGFVRAVVESGLGLLEKQHGLKDDGLVLVLTDTRGDQVESVQQQVGAEGDEHQAEVVGHDRPAKVGKEVEQYETSDGSDDQKDAKGIKTPYPYT